MPQTLTFPSQSPKSSNVRWFSHTRPADVAASRSAAADVVLFLRFVRLPSAPINDNTPVKYRAPRRSQRISSLLPPMVFCSVVPSLVLVALSRRLSHRCHQSYTSVVIQPKPCDDSVFHNSSRTTIRGPIWRSRLRPASKTLVSWSRDW